ncbi:ketoacyl-ACP synthase III [Ravibacter arvi]
MERQRNTIITGSGSYIPTRRILNEDFIHHVFYEQNGTRLARPAAETIEKFEKITGIRERRYAAEGLTASDMGFFAANEALISSMTEPESLDYIIFAHNFGDVQAPNRKGEFIPALSSRVKQSLNIRNVSSVALDLPFGCAGWLQGVIFADQLIQLGKANKIMVIGAETLSRVCAPHDRDSMIYADGGGAMILEAAESEKRAGILASIARSYNEDLTYVLKMDKSSNPDFADDGLFLKMNGRKLYENMLKKMPSLIEEVLNTAGIGVADLDKILIHQANEKMDEAILKQVFNA